jgi:hypothetical protein
MVKGAPTLNREALAALESFIVNNKLDVFMLDPWVSFHSVRESENTDMDLVIKEGLRPIARRTNSAGEIFHHPGKPKPGQDTVVEDARGASAIIYAVRSARVFNFMNADEATKLGIRENERRRHIRISNGKANYGPLDKADWIKIEVENLANGDEVACGSSWKPQNPFEGVSTADMETSARLAQTSAFRFDVRSPKWFGWALAKQLKIRVAYKGDNDPKDMARLKAIIQTWVKNNVLEVIKRKDEKDRKEYEFIVAGPASRCASTDDDNMVVDDDDPDCQTCAQPSQTFANGDSEAGELRRLGFPPFRGGTNTSAHTARDSDTPASNVPPPEKNAANGFRPTTFIGAEPPGTPCARCGKDEAAGHVCLYRDESTMRSEALHEQCAEAWSNFPPPARSTGNDSSNE